MLHAHPRIAIPPETRFLVEIHERRLEFGDPTVRATRRAIAEEITSDHRLDRLDIDLQRVRAGIEAAEPTLGAMLAVVYREFASRFGAVRWGDKRPSYIRRLPVLLDLFPDAQIVHIIRDGRDCVASLKRMPWWRHGVPAAIEKWVDAMQKADEARRTLSPNQYHELRYEDLVADPTRTLGHLCRFLSEEFDEDMLAPHEVADIIPDRRRWHRNTREPVSDRAVHRWQEDLTAPELRLMEAVAGRHLRRWGYTLRDGVRPLPPPSGMSAYISAASRRALSDRRWGLRETVVRRRYPYPVAFSEPGDRPPVQHDEGRIDTWAP